MNDYIISSPTNGELFDELQELFSPLRRLDPSKIQVFVHGSWADNSRTDFSDLDDLIIIDDEYFSEAKTVLDEIENNFQKIDTTQHHGHWLIRKSELNDYDNSILPLFILEGSICIYGSNTVKATINKKKTDKGNILRLRNTCRNIEKFYAQYKSGTLNVYDYKRFVGSVVLIPPIIFQLQNSNIDKKSAIFQADQIFSEYSLNLIKWATEVRKNWNVFSLDERYVEMQKQMAEFSTAKDFRNFMEHSGPVILPENLSDILLTQELIEAYIDESLIYIDKIKLKAISPEDYTNGYTVLEKFAISNNALIIGQFGNINYPSISDLDVLICFNDDGYADKCKIIDEFISNDELLSYLFAHSPLYASRSMLKHLKFLHTMNDLEISYNPENIVIDSNVTSGYRDFMNVIWTFSFFRTIEGIKKTGIRYSDCRSLLLTLKNLQTSVNNLENILNLENSNSLAISHQIRTEIINNIGSHDHLRKNIEQEIFNSIYKLEELLSIADSKIENIGNVININGYYSYKVSNRTYIENRFGRSVFHVNKLFYQYLYNIINRVDHNSEEYLNAVKHTYSIYQKNGGYINWHSIILPEVFFSQNKLRRKLSLIKHELKSFIKPKI
jgi:hypothetical protein